MTASVGMLSTLVLMALVIAAVTPVILIILLIRDWTRREQW